MVHHVQAIITFSGLWLGDCSDLPSPTMFGAKSALEIPASSMDKLMVRMFGLSSSLYSDLDRTVYGKPGHGTRLMSPTTGRLRHKGPVLTHIPEPRTVVALSRRKFIAEDVYPQGTTEIHWSIPSHFLKHPVKGRPSLEVAAGSFSEKDAQSSQNISEMFQRSMSRRETFATAAALMPLSLPHRVVMAAPAQDKLASIQEDAIAAFNRRDFKTAIAGLKDLTELQPDNPDWHEAQGEVYTDSKDFRAAIEQFGVALDLTPQSNGGAKARLLSGRALAHEGLSNWDEALKDYNDALDLAKDYGYLPDPYILNNKGNVLTSKGEYVLARECFLESSRLFQSASKEAGQQQRLQGSVYASSNAALALAQIGDVKEAVVEMSRVRRRAPGNVDMRAALAALYYANGEPDKAAAEWDFACESISVGCENYRSRDWVQRIRRWPPVMVDALSDFLKLYRLP